MNKKINTFIFDCFGVVCSPPLSSWYKDNMLNRGLADDKLLDIFRDYDLDNLSEEDVIEYFSKYEGINSNKKEIRDQIDSYLKLDAKLSNIIKKLKEKGFKTILLSNGNTNFFERKIYIDYPEFRDLFDEIVISSSVKMVKPDPSIYLHALEKINSKAGESLFIDDNQTNVDGAIKVGIQGFLYIDSISFIEYINKLGIDLNN